VRHSFSLRDPAGKIEVGLAPQLLVHSEREEVR